MTKIAKGARAKAPWRKPEIKRILAGSAEAGSNPGNDGNGGHTGS